jgi:hypothetical protein
VARYAIDVMVSVVVGERLPALLVQHCDLSIARKPDKEVLICCGVRGTRAHILTPSVNLISPVWRGYSDARPAISRASLALNCLAPDIIAGIAEATEPPDLARKTLASALFRSIESPSADCSGFQDHVGLLSLMTSIAGAFGPLIGQVLFARWILPSTSMGHEQRSCNLSLPSPG